ncbi:MULTISPECIES: hypothetical protein [unclassified Serratia (in: enterobacteria)]|uniref:hypothetical protein n=1 Tax=unclassified Serratia (in: enterobacteria) TaxID=2647522 RepID=UPI0004FF99CF|nr:MULTISPECIES: hypothetical protein [unclassified Serratia (in: enterobacteria)]KFK94560.1 hypothetical protein JV45_11575 [Serratia sp. Ag2]KFK95780.1 hypothetical protein IV04_20350 [Serratia sp. Ag1]
MAVEKIAFVFPTLMRPGMATNGIYRPEISMHLNRKGEKHLMAITVGIMFSSTESYFTEVDINHTDDLANPDEITDGRAEYLYGEKVGDDQQLSIYSMLASSVNLDKEGVYRVIIRIFKSEHGVKVGEPVTMGECYFYVSHTEAQQ